jgi:Amt family ammonium transporter
VTPWASLLIGLLGTLLYTLSCRLYLKLSLDDPLESSQLHGLCGLWGVLSVGFFDPSDGLFYTGWIPL